MFVSALVICGNNYVHNLNTVMQLFPTTIEHVLHAMWPWFKANKQNIRAM